MKPTPSPQDQQRDEEFIRILKRLGAISAEYPAALRAARRAAFISQVEQQNLNLAADELLAQEKFVRCLENLKPYRSEYPSALLAARRAAFIAKIEQYQGAEVVEEAYAEDRQIIQFLTTLKSIEKEYPPDLLSARRAAFRRQIEAGSRVSVLESLRTSVWSLFLGKIRTLSLPTMNTMRTSAVVLVLMLAALLGSLLGSPIQSIVPASSPGDVSQPGPVSLATSTGALAQVICKPGYLPPLCLAKEFDKSQDLTFSGNGTARPAVAKDTLPGYSGIHRSAYVNDGLYGPGASWISNSAYSWIKIDLGKTTTINTVTFGRDRLGSFNDRDPGQFVIAVALFDNIYADGNSSNDYVEYTEIYNSEEIGFDGVVSGPETVKAEFGPVMARFVKIVFANPGTAVDEVEVFLMQPPGSADSPTRRPKDNLPGPAVPFTATSTPLPTKTATPVPTSTPLPTKTATPVPTDTPLPPDTATPVPTNTPLPPDTATPVPIDTPVPLPSDTPLPPTELFVPFTEPTATPPPVEEP
jgi:hypothetical protein